MVVRARRSRPLAVHGQCQAAKSANGQRYPAAIVTHGRATKSSVLNELIARIAYRTRLPAAFLCAAPESWRCGRAAPGRRDLNVAAENGEGRSNSMIS